MVRGSDNSTDSSTTRGTSAAVHKKRRRSSRQEKHPSPDSSTNSSSQSDDRQESVSGTLEGVSHGPSSKRKKRNLPATTTKAAPAIGFHHRLFATPRPSKKRPTVSESNPPSQRSLPQQSTERIPDKIKQIVLGKRFLRKEDPNNGQTCDLHSEDLAGKVQEKSKELNGHASTLNMGHNKRRKRDGRRERHPPPPSQQRVQSKPTNVARTRRYRSFKGALVRVTKGPYKGFVGFVVSSDMDFFELVSARDADRTCVVRRFSVERIADKDNRRPLDVECDQTSDEMRQLFLRSLETTLTSETSLPAGGDDTWARAVKELGPMPPTYDETR